MGPMGPRECLLAQSADRGSSIRPLLLKMCFQCLVSLSVHQKFRLHLRSGVQAPLADKPALRPLLPLFPRIFCAAVGSYFFLVIVFEQFLIQIAIGQVLQLLQSDAHVFCRPIASPKTVRVSMHLGSWLFPAMALFALIFRAGCVVLHVHRQRARGGN